MESRGFVPRINDNMTCTGQIYPLWIIVLYIVCMPNYVSLLLIIVIGSRQKISGNESHVFFMGSRAAVSFSS